MSKSKAKTYVPDSPGDDYTIQERIDRLANDLPAGFRLAETKKSKEDKPTPGLLIDLDEKELIATRYSDFDQAWKYMFIYDHLCKEQAGRSASWAKGIGMKNTTCIGYEELLQEARIKVLRLLRAGKEVHKISIQRHLKRYIKNNSPGVGSKEEEYDDEFTDYAHP